MLHSAGANVLVWLLRVLTKWPARVHGRGDFLPGSPESFPVFAFTSRVGFSELIAALGMWQESRSILWHRDIALSRLRWLKRRFFPPLNGLGTRVKTN